MLLNHSTSRSLLRSRHQLPRLPHLLGGLVVAFTGFSIPASAQEKAFDGEFSVQRFDPAPGPRNFVTTRGARSDGNMAWSGAFMANYAFQPLMVRSCISATDCSAPNATRGDDVKVVENLVTADVMGSLTPIPKLQLGLRVPVTYSKGQGLTAQGTSDLNQLSAVGLGDMMLEAKYRFYGEHDSPFAVAGGAFITAPLGTATAKGSYIGDTLPTVGVRAIGDFMAGPLSVAGNLVGVFRDSSRIGSTSLGSEFRYNVGAAYRASPVVSVLVDGFGSTRFSAENGTNALEALLGARVFLSKFTVTGGAGTGLIQGVGVPTVRAFLGLAYISEPRDRDGDGLDDSADACPTVPEDRDNFHDEDGCPETDNDDDGIADTADKCPDQAEDGDDFEDRDGCPEPDNDKDGINDDRDSCPLQAETKNGFKDEDGCPDAKDADSDGVADASDKCPNEAEDTDGYQDEDGCPDLDNDGDGIPDDKDECVDEAETKNDFDDEDGCPDEAPAAGGVKPAGKAVAKPGAAVAPKK